MKQNQNAIQSKAKQNKTSISDANATSVSLALSCIDMLLIDLLGDDLFLLLLNVMDRLTFFHFFLEFIHQNL